MTTSELLNRILDKLRTAKVTFVSIDTAGEIAFDWGYNRYVVGVDSDGLIYECGGSPAQYGCWMEGVLNGKARDDKGALVE